MLRFSCFFSRPCLMPCNHQNCHRRCLPASRPSALLLKLPSPSKSITSLAVHTNCRRLPRGHASRRHPQVLRWLREQRTKASGSRPREQVPQQHDRGESRWRKWLRHQQPRSSGGRSTKHDDHHHRRLQPRPSLVLILYRLHPNHQ